MAKKVEVKSITIQFPDGEAKEMSIEDAKELYTQLGALFEENLRYIPQAPVIIEKKKAWPDWDPPQVPYVEWEKNTTPKVWCNCLESWEPHVTEG